MPKGMPTALARVIACSVVLLFQGCASPPATSPDPDATPQRSDASFEKLRHVENQPKEPSQPVRKQAEPTGPTKPVAQSSESQPSADEQYLTATGHGDLSKGPLICQRVADTAARAELAKLLRVTIKEHAIDRVRERAGKPFEQDIEVVREELVNELLLDVRIVDRNVDKAAGTCSSTAVMPKSNLTSKEAENSPANTQAPER